MQSFDFEGKTNKNISGGQVSMDDLHSLQVHLLLKGLLRKEKKKKKGEM
jgi:hypothetical protein